MGTPLLRARSAAVYSSAGLALIVIISVGIYVARSAVPRPTDFDADLNGIRKELAALDAPAAKLDQGRQVEETRAVFSFRRASLSGLPEDYRAAESAIADAIRVSGTTQDLAFLRSGLELKLHRLPEVERDLRRVRPFDPSSELVAMRGDLDFQLGKVPEARSAYKNAIQKDRNWANLSRLAFLESVVGNEKSADALYAEASHQIGASEMRA